MAALKLNQEKLRKVLALADSDREGEAFAALRVARQMMAEAGVSFRDILDAGPPEVRPRPENRPNNDNPREARRIAEMSQRMAALKRQLASKSSALEDEHSRTVDLRRQIQLLDRTLGKKIDECEGWKRRAWQNLWHRERLKM